MDKRAMSNEAIAEFLNRDAAQGLSDTARRVLERRYLRRDDQGRVCETPEALYERVSTLR